MNADADAPEVVDKDADARPGLEPDYCVLRADGQPAADVVDGYGPAEQQEGVHGDLCRQGRVNRDVNNGSRPPHISG